MSKAASITEKLMRQGKEIKLNSTGSRNFDFFFCVDLAAGGEVLFLTRRLDIGLCLQPTFEILLIFHSFLRSSVLRRSTAHYATPTQNL